MNNPDTLIALHFQCKPSWDTSPVSDLIAASQNKASLYCAAFTWLSIGSLPVTLLSVFLKSLLCKILRNSFYCNDVLNEIEKCALEELVLQWTLTLTSDSTRLIFAHIKMLLHPIETSGEINRPDIFSSEGVWPTSLTTTCYLHHCSGLCTF